MNKYFIEVDFSDGEFDLTAGELGPFFATEDVVDSIASNLVGVPLAEVAGYGNYHSWMPGVPFPADTVIANAYAVQDHDW